jgi:hypothetical protein
LKIASSVKPTAPRPPAGSGKQISPTTTTNTFS